MRSHYLGAAAPLVLMAACATGGRHHARVASSSVPARAPGRTVPELTAVLADANTDAAARAAAAWELATAGDVAEDLRAIVRRAVESDPDDGVRCAATWAYTHLRFGGAEPQWQGGYDRPPRVIHQEHPDYPKGPFQKRIQGTVLLELLIDEKGEVAHVEVHESVPQLDEAAIECIRTWRFEPAQRQGRPVCTVARAPVAFKIY